MANVAEQTLLGTTAVLNKLGAGDDALTFITGYRYAENLLKTVNGMTFFYDANWGNNVSSRRTFPLAFFHLKGIHEVMESEVQTKRMLFYNSQNNVSIDSTTGGLINVVADNIINKPKSYKLDVIVPYDNLTMLFNTMFLSSYQISTAVNTLYGSNTATRWTNNLVSYSVPVVNTIKELLNGLLNLKGAVSTDWLTNIMSTPSYNKDSLEAMWRNRTILKLKLWNGWSYKYVVITNIDITKESTEHGVEEATISCTEIPIMTMRNKMQALKADSKWFMTWQKLKDAVNKPIKATAKYIVNSWGAESLMKIQSPTGDPIENDVY